MITPTAALAALNAFREATNGNVVSPEEATRRANICAAPCPMKRRIKVRPMDQLGRALGLMANKHRVPDELQGYKCGACGCPLLNLIPCLPATLHRDSPDEAATRQREAPACWLPAAIKEVQP